MRKSIGHPVLALLAEHGFAGEIIVAKRFPWRVVVVKVSRPRLTFHVQVEVDRRGDPVHRLSGASVMLRHSGVGFQRGDVPVDLSADIPTEIVTALMEQTARHSWLTWDERPDDLRLLAMRAYDDRFYGFIVDGKGAMVRFDVGRGSSGIALLDGKFEGVDAEDQVRRFLTYQVKDICDRVGIAPVDIPAVVP